MRECRFIAGLLVLAVLARGVECLRTDLDLCAHALASSAASPLEDPTDHDPNESGCLCKGAVAVPTCELSDGRSFEQTGGFIPVGQWPHILLVSSTEHSGLIEANLPPPIASASLRALLSVWRI
ncbi:MAG TPA: hypothetical protein VGJ16_01555 [Pirellulales bacterium]|jgi:hypothetical protein